MIPILQNHDIITAEIYVKLGVSESRSQFGVIEKFGKHGTEHHSQLENELICSLADIKTLFSVKSKW